MIDSIIGDVSMVVSINRYRDHVVIPFKIQINRQLNVVLIWQGAKTQMDLRKHI